MVLPIPRVMASTPLGTSSGLTGFCRLFATCFRPAVNDLVSRMRYTEIIRNHPKSGLGYWGQEMLHLPEAVRVAHSHASSENFYKWHLSATMAGCYFQDQEYAGF